MSWPPSVPFNLQCSFRATVWCTSHDCLMDVLIAGALQGTEIIHWSKVTQEELFLSGRLVSVTWLPDIHPSCWIMSVTGSKRPCVDLWSRLTSSTHLCKCAWLGHCMITWPCCRFITLSLSSWWGFLSRVKHILSSSFFCKKKNKPWQEHSDTKCSLPCISDSLQCSFFLCVTSQYSKIYTVNDFQ